MDEETGLTLLERFFIFLGSRFKRKNTNKSEPVESYSKFRKLVEGVGGESDYKVADLCDEALRIAGQRLGLIEKIQELEEKMNEIQSFDQLSPEEAEQLKKMLDSFISLTKERTAFRYQISDFDKNVSYMESLETDADQAMPFILDAEKSQRILRHDLGQLRGEKSELEYERELLENGIVFIHKFTYVMVFIFCAVTLYLGYIYMFRGSVIFFAITVLVLLAIVIISLLYFFRRRMRYELIMNIKKQQRAVDLLNKKNAVYAHYSNFLNYEYRKYKVRNSQMLKSNLNDYNRYKHICARIDAIRQIMYETERNIEQFLREKKIHNIHASIEQFAQTVDIDDKKQYYKELSREKTALEKNLQDLDVRHENLWDSLVALRDKDTSEEKVADHVIQAYIEEVTRLITPVEKSKK